MSIWREPAVWNLKHRHRPEADVLRRISFGLLVPFLAVAAVALVYLWQPLPLQILRNAVFDQYQRWHPRTYRDVPVRIIDIDDESLRRLGQWPWPRTKLADLVSHLRDAGAAAIVFDMIFAEPDRTSPAAMEKLWQPPPEVRRQISRLADHDRILAEAIGRGGTVLGFAVGRKGEGGVPPAAKAHYVVVGEPPYRFLPDFPALVSSLPLLADAAAGNGVLTFIPDPDGVVRRVPLLVRHEKTLLPSLVAEALRVAQGTHNYIVRSAAEKGVGLVELRVGALAIPTTSQGEIWVDYTGPVAKRYLPAWKVLAGLVSPEEMEGRILVVGTSAQGLMDLRFSPLGAAIPGVEIHAQALEQLLGGARLYRPSWAEAVEILAIVGGGLAVGGIALASGALFSFLAFAFFLATVWLGAWQAFVVHGLLLDPVAPSLVIVLAFILSSIVRHRLSERRQRWVKQAFSRYVSPNLVSYLVDHPESLALGGDRRQCSFIFTDLAGFTSLMERLDPGKAVTLLNDYLDRMIAIAFAHQGTLDRIVGDAVAIMFSAPVAQADHQRRALTCALAMQRFAARYVADLEAKGVGFCQTRMGIHSGEVIVGNFGGSTIFDYRALGDPVNTASRLESVNKLLGTLMCVSEATLSGCPDMPVRPVGRLVLRGKSQPLKVFEPLDPEGLAMADPEYQEAYERMCREDPEALVAFEALAARRPHDGLAAFHLRRLRAGQTGDLIVMVEKK